MDQLQPLFNQLSARVKADDHEAAVQVCDQILAAAPGDADALHAKMVSLIELGQYEGALQLADSSPAIVNSIRFERAYCLYQRHREQDSLTLLMPNGTDPTESREMQLAAQIYYRLGEYARSAELFRKSEAIGGPSAELSTNIIAALVSAGASSDGIEYARSVAGAEAADAKPHELVYNYACAAIWQGQLRTAKRLLQRSIDLCRETMNEGDDWTEEEVEVRTIYLRIAHLLASVPPQLALHGPARRAAGSLVCPTDMHHTTAMLVGELETPAAVVAAVFLVVPSCTSSPIASRAFLANLATTSE